MKVQCIDGQWISGSGRRFTSLNPATNDTVWTGHAASKTQVDQAISAARKASIDWAKTDIVKRIELVEKFAEQLKGHTKEFAQLICSETGKPTWECQTEVAAMIGKVAISIKAYKERTGEKVQEMAGQTSVIRHRPHGVVAVFGPYNFPGHLPNGHIIPALIAGNTIVYKPSELTPMVAERYMQIFQEAGLPNGVINLVQGEVETGQALAGHPAIDGLFFTGSSNTGKLIHQQFAGQPGKILALEMGGNNPLIVDDITNIPAAVHEIIQSAFITSGQRCTCARRLFIKEGETGDTLLASLIDATKNIQVGMPSAENQPFMGAMISAKAALDMLAVQTHLQDLGGKSLLEMGLLEDNTGFLTPGIIDVNAIAELPDEEHFGPLLKVRRYANLSEAIQEANNTNFGLSASLLADSEQDYQTFSQHIRAGIVNWNRPTTGASSAAPFGGIGDSGNHRSSAYYAADYCAYPVASVEAKELTLPTTFSPGLNINASL